MKEAPSVSNACAPLKKHYAHVIIDKKIYFCLLCQIIGRTAGERGDVRNMLPDGASGHIRGQKITERSRKDDMDFEKLIYAVEDGIAVITMNYMKNLNAIDEQMADELLQAVDMAEQDPAVRVVVLKGSKKAFSAGGDIGYFYQLIQAGGEVSMDGLIGKVGRVADGLKRMSKMVVTSVCGAAAGAGVGLALGGDFMICADNAKFILAFVNLGLVPDTGSTYLLAKSIGTARTMELAATGRPVSAQEAKALGLAYQVTTVDELDAATMAFAKKLAAGPLISYKNIKKQLYACSYSDYRQWLEETEVPTQHECSGSMDFQEGCKAFMEKRRAVFQGK